MADTSAKVPTDGSDDAEDHEDEDEDLEEESENVDRGDRGDGVAARMRVCGGSWCHCANERREAQGVSRWTSQCRGGRGKKQRLERVSSERHAISWLVGLAGKVSPGTVPCEPSGLILLWLTVVSLWSLKVQDNTLMHLMSFNAKLSTSFGPTLGPQDGPVCG